MNAPRLLLGDCRERLGELPNRSVDSVVTDPPYELGFMGKKWDASGIAYDVSVWRAVLRVLKPGGHLLAFGGTRTYHRMTCAIEDAGFEIRDSLHWLYGTGFPKSVDLGEGRGSALKPGHEPIVLARRPVEGTLAANVLAHGTGGLRIDECRVGPRWPANVLLDEDAAAELDAQSGHLKAGGRLTGDEPSSRTDTVYGEMRRSAWQPHGDSGGASRFFYVAKASRKERDLGCKHLAPKTGGEATGRKDGSAGTRNPRAGAGRTGGARNHHPTVKPVQLMRYLCRLVTPPGGLVLDPFAGSGTTGVAARLEGLQFVGIEASAEYMTICKARVLPDG